MPVPKTSDSKTMPVPDDAGESRPHSPTRVRAQGETMVGQLFKELFTARAPVVPLDKGDVDPASARRSGRPDQPSRPAAEVPPPARPRPDSVLDDSDYDPGALDAPAAGQAEDFPDFGAGEGAAKKRGPGDPDSTDMAFGIGPSGETEQAAAERASAEAGAAQAVNEVPASSSGSGRIPVEAPAKTLAALAAPRVFDLAGGLSAPGWTILRKALTVVFFASLVAVVAYGLVIGALAATTLLLYQSLYGAGPWIALPPATAERLGEILQVTQWCGVSACLAAFVGRWMWLAVPGETRLRGTLTASLVITTIALIPLGVLWTMGLIGRLTGQVPRWVQPQVAMQMLVGGLLAWAVGEIVLTRFLKALARCLDEPAKARSIGRLSLEMFGATLIGFCVAVYFRFAELSWEMTDRLMVYLSIGAVVVGLYLGVRMLIVVRSLRNVIAGHQAGAFPATADAGTDRPRGEAAADRTEGGAADAPSAAAESRVDSEQPAAHKPRQESTTHDSAAPRSEDRPRVEPRPPSSSASSGPSGPPRIKKKKKKNWGR
jgi:hypothetical protein